MSLQQLKFDKKFPYIILNKKTNLALQAPFEKLQQSDRVELGPVNHNNLRQLWNIMKYDNNKVFIASCLTDRVLTMTGNTVVLKSGHYSDVYHWIIDSSMPQQIKIQNAKNLHLFLSQEKKMATLSKYKQQWEFIKVEDNQSLNRTCTIQDLDHGKAIDVTSGSYQEGVQICLWDIHYRFNQRWRLYKAGEVYIIKSFKTELNLDIKGGKAQSGTQIVQWYSNGNKNQFWKLQPKGNNIFRISSWLQSQIEMGHHNSKLYTHKGQKYLWLIDGFIPE